MTLSLALFSLDKNQEIANMSTPRSARPIARRGVPLFALRILFCLKEGGLPRRAKPTLSVFIRRLCPRRGAHQRFCANWRPRFRWAA